MSKSLGQVKSESFAHHASVIPAEVPEHFAQIQELAYFKAEKRNFEPGHELEDWLEAEKELSVR
jgi:hypothetical protein